MPASSDDTSMQTLCSIYSTSEKQEMSDNVQRSTTSDR